MCQFRGFSGLVGLLSKLVAKSGVKTGMKSRGQRNRFGIAQNLDTPLGLIQDHGAIFAMCQMTLEFLFSGEFKFAVDIVRNLANDSFTIQLGAP